MTAQKIGETKHITKPPMGGQSTRLYKCRKGWLYVQVRKSYADIHRMFDMYVRHACSTCVFMTFMCKFVSWNLITPCVFQWVPSCFWHMSAFLQTEYAEYAAMITADFTDFLQVILLWSASKATEWKSQNIRRRFDPKTIPK